MARQKGKGLSGFARVVNSPLLHTQYININIDFGVSDNDRIKNNSGVLNKF